MSNEPSSHPTAATGGQDAESEESGLYSRTREAFNALIEAEVWTEQLLEAADRLKQAITEYPGSKELWYETPADPEDDTDVRELIEEIRRDIPSGFGHVWRRADNWHKSERSFREAIQRAKVAVDRASVELDSPTTAPLRRTSVAIKRCIRNLSGSVPYARSSPWGEGACPDVIQATRTALRSVRRWTEELRLLVQPEHTLPPPCYYHAQTLASSEDVSSGVLPVSTKEETQDVDLEVAAERTAGADDLSPTVSTAPSRDTPPRAQLSAAERRADLVAKKDWERLARALTTSQAWILRTLHENKAFEAHDKVSREYLVELRFGNKGSARPGSLKDPLRQLVDLSLLETEQGSAAGYWLTDKGLAVARVPMEGDGPSDPASEVGEPEDAPSPPNPF